jgi:hypothetical protein
VHPLRVHDGAETASAISLKQASTIAEMRIDTLSSFVPSFFPFAPAP